MTTDAARAMSTPARLGSLHLPNRVVAAPMTRRCADAAGVPEPAAAAYYAQRASAGLIIAEASTPSLVGKAYPNSAALYNGAHVAGWRRVTDAVRAAGGRMFALIRHGGRVGHPDTSCRTPLAPSPIALPGSMFTPKGTQDAVVPREMTVADIEETVADFAAAARKAVDAGFAGVEVHAGDGYLLHQFLAGNTNRRTDAYGGSAAGRIRFTTEVVAAVAAEIGAERVGVRIAPGAGVNGIEEGDTADIYAALTEALSGFELAYLHVVFVDPGDTVFRGIRRAWPGMLIGNPVHGRCGPPPTDGGRQTAERLLAAGADLVVAPSGFKARGGHRASRA
ncbi:oxidoreductase [Yinghuangia soli]|uniref:Alkene reductase n=1 Tax=Yinghuangia soli TaxID=2908204 RepID=A0AA41Q1U5_9ACTN|nr:alkene reductase [Yinghuangia soli]MCF2529642.1 alkene reductase [Yinghuangia soli]